MNKIEAFQASDGVLFATKEQCQTHESSLTWRTRINEFVESDFCPYQRGTAQEGMVHKVIVGWEQFKEARAASG